MTENKKEHFFEQRLFDLAARAYHSEFPTFTDFMTTKEHMLMNRIRKQIKDVDVVCWGGHEDCDHVVCGFFPVDRTENRLDDFPVSCILVQAKNEKYAQNLCHRDYLGAILNLGIERSLIGDIRICNQTAFVFCKEEFASFVVENFTMVKHTTVECRILDNAEEIPKQQYDITTKTIASLRLDNVVAAMACSSRGKASELISQGKVIVDHEEKDSVSYACKDGMIITIRGYGKFRLEAKEGDVSKKGKQKITIYKYS